VTECDIPTTDSDRILFPVVNVFHSHKVIKQKTMKLILLFQAVLLFTACSTIEIKESDVFDAHRTITPDTFNFTEYTIHEQMLETEDGVKLNSWFLKNEKAVASVLYLGGNGFLMVKSRPLIEAYSKIPVNLLLVDYRGYGISSGEPSVAGVMSDAKTAFQFLSGMDIPASDHIFVHGHSMGSFLSAYIADTEEVDGYILESPIADVNSWTKSLVPWILRPFIRFDIDASIQSQDNSERVTNIGVPLLILGGNSDDITPFSMAEALYKKSASVSKELVKIDGGNHNNLPVYPVYREKLLEFIHQSIEP
jgi:uncharacterized protein